MEEEEGEGNSNNSLRLPDKAREEAEEGGVAPRKEERKEMRRGSSCRAEREEEREGQGGRRHCKEKGEGLGGSRCSEEKEEEGGASWSLDATGKGTEDSEVSWR